MQYSTLEGGGCNYNAGNQEYCTTGQGAHVYVVYSIFI